jgi:hypothetical protein
LAVWLIIYCKCDFYALATTIKDTGIYILQEEARNLAAVCHCHCCRQSWLPNALKEQTGILKGCYAYRDRPDNKQYRF